MMRAVWFAGVMLAGALVGAQHADAQAEATKPEMMLPRVTSVTVDWDSVRSEVAALPALDPADSGGAPLTRLNAAAAPKFTGIEKSAVPVLLPIDPDALLKDSAVVDGAGFRAHFFMAGPAGYDAAFTLTPPAASDVANFESKDEPLVLISASAIHYELDPPVADPARPSKELEQLIPALPAGSKLFAHVQRYSVPTASMWH
jgi:hypothetical protein